MTNTKSTKRALLASIMALLLCFSMLLGTTYAWFTDSVTSATNKIVAGNLDVELYHADKAQPTDELVGDTTKLFDDVTLWEPGAIVWEKFTVKNVGSLALKYNLSVNVNDISTVNGKSLADVLKIAVLDQMPTRENVAAAETKNLATFNLASGEILNSNESAEFYVAIYWAPSANDNDYNVANGELYANLSVTLLATQATVESDGFDNQYDKDATYPEINTVDTWDGTADTSWYDPANPLNEYDITTAEQLAGLAELVSGDTTFKGVTFTLMNDLDLYCEDTTPSADGDPLSFRPIGDKSKNGTFEGTFNGNGKTIDNLYQNGWDLGYDWYHYGSYGLFGNLNDATVKDLTITGAESYIEGGDVGGITGSATGTCVFENITIADSDFATYNNGNGGIIGWSGAGEYTFRNITIADDVTLAGLWGSFDSSIGGIVGQGETGATYNFENVDIACRLDVYNDCTASYDYYNYRMCGMIIGRLKETTTIDGSNYPDTSKYNITCNNVTVTYGDWANYHYCDPTPGYNNGRGMRVEAGYAYEGLPADYDHTQCTKHHLELIPFDQIFGGDQLGVKGLMTYDGVTVIYNNK